MQNNLQSSICNLQSNIVVVLHQPRNGANIGATVRVLKNMGLRRLRLVKPAVFDPAVVETMAHRSGDLLAAAETFETLDAAVADAMFVVGTSGRVRSNGPTPQTPRSIAPEVLRQAQVGTVALLFGNEDNGLDNDDLARCHALVRIPTDPDYSSLNLAQAVLLLAYELHLATAEPALPPPPHTRAPAAQLTQLAELIGQLLDQIDFLKAPHATPQLMRRLRRLLLRAAPDQDEVRLLQAVVRALLRATRE